MKIKYSNPFVFRLVLSLNLICLGLHAQDASLVVALKVQDFFQGSPVAPALRDDAPTMGFWALAELASPGSIQGGSVDLPGGGNRPLVFHADDDQFRFEDYFDGMDKLAAAYPDGNYTLNLSTLNDGPQAMILNLSGDAWPSAARVANLNALQGFDATQDFTLRWDPMVGGTVDDLIIVSLYSHQDGQEFDSGDPGAPGALDGTATSVVIPANTFTPGVDLEVELLFVRIVDTSPTYAEAFAAYLKITRCEGRTLGGTDTKFPQLSGQIPSQDTGNVDRDAVLSFSFDEPMQSGLAIAWTGVSGAAFSYTWSPDRRTLFCRYNTALPASTQIGWVLNPGGQPAGFRDLAGNALFERQGSFTTGAGSSAPGTDVRLLLVGKGRLYHQTGSVPSGPGTVGAFLSADFRSVNAVTNGLITLPNARTAAIEFNDEHSGLESDLIYGNQSDLDLFFPSGDYVVNLNTIRDGARTVTLTLSGDQYPDAPTVINLSSAQTIDPTADFQINWQAFAGGTASDFVVLGIESEYGQLVFETPDVGESGALNGLATGILLPAGMLAPGRTYSANLAFLRVADQETLAYPGALAAAGYFTETAFTMATTGSVVGPTLSVLPPAGNLFQAQLVGDAGVPYTIYSSFDLNDWDIYWPAYFARGTKTFPFSYPLTGAPGNRRFFKALEGVPGGGPF